MKKTIIAILAALALANEAGAHEAQRSMDQMHGGCESFAMDMKGEFALWKAEETPVEALEKVTEGAQALSIDRKYSVALRPHPSVHFAMTPLKDRGGTDKFSGLLHLQVPETGLYGVAASTGLWIDIVGDAALIPAARFEMQTGCDSIFKIVEFHLTAGTDYWLQLNGSSADKVTLLIARRKH